MSKTGPNFFKSNFITSVPEGEEDLALGGRRKQSVNLTPMDQSQLRATGTNFSTISFLEDDPVEALTKEVRDRRYIEFLEGQQKLLYKQPPPVGALYEPDIANSRFSNPFVSGRRGVSENGRETG